MKRVENARGATEFKSAEKICRDDARAVEAKRGGTTEAERKRAEFAKQQITQARLAGMAEEYRALGPIDPRGATAEAKATSLQAAYFFAETTLHAKDGEVGA